MMHELDMQRLTRELRETTQRNIRQQEDHKKAKLALFWIAVGAVVGTLLGIGYTLGAH